MSIPARLRGSTGTWAGQYHLWLSPPDPPIECSSTAEVTAVGEGRFLALRYDWSYDGKRQEGFILLGDDPATARCAATWADSFHNSHRQMPCDGPLAGDGEINVRGSYPAPPGPDWGWRTLLEHPSPDALVIRMFNITPDGLEELAVEATYRRR
jgi:hypothetical protein